MLYAINQLSENVLMRIGLTYDLRSEYLAAGYSMEETAELDSETTIEAIESALLAAGYEVQRVGNLKQLVQALAAGTRWDMVFNIAEGLRGVGREAAVPALLDAYQIPYVFSDPAVMALGLHKAHTKAVVRQAGVPTADWVLVHSSTDLAEAHDLATRHGWPLFVKPVYEGTGKGISSTSRVPTFLDLGATCFDRINRFRQPVLVEPYLPGREFTVAILGTGPQATLFGTFEIILGEHAEDCGYTYENKQQYEQKVTYELVSGLNDPEVAAAERIALAAWLVLGCRDGGRVDLRSNAQGEPLFLEVNPLAGLHPIHSDLPLIAQALGVSYPDLIIRLVSSALDRTLGAGSSVSTQYA